MIQGTSGSPGYIDGLPLLIGRADTSGATQIYEEGFRLSGGDMTGSCVGPVTDSDMLAEMGDPTVKFNVDLSYGCTLSYTLQELKDVCNSINTPVANLEIYKNLNNIDTFGKFGNADVYKTNVSAALISPSFLLLLIFRFLLTVIRTGRKSSRRLH